MSLEGDACSCCNEMVPYNVDNCPKGSFVGFPNVRVARKMKADLAGRHTAAREAGDTRNVSDLIQRLDDLLNGAKASINLAPRIVANLANGQPYRSYHESCELGQRPLAKRINHAHRTAVDAKVHIGYGDRIINAALSPDGRGLSNYGKIALLLKDGAISDRCSLLSENAFDYFQSHKLWDPDKPEPLGFRALWEDRAALGVAKLEPLVKENMSDEDLCDLILHSGADRHDDRYIEVHVIDFLQREYVGSFYRARAFDQDEAKLWTSIVEKLTAEGAKELTAAND